MSDKHSTSKFGTSSSRTDRAEDPKKPGPADEQSDANAKFFTHLITILSVSSGMVGVCLTAIGLVGILKGLNRVETVVDDLLAIAAMLFMVATFLAFLGMRTSLANTWRGFRLILDSVFSAGLVLVVLATLLLTWVLI
jgi:hypothetical protein